MLTSHQRISVESIDDFFGNTVSLFENVCFASGESTTKEDSPLKIGKIVEIRVWPEKRKYRKNDPVIKIEIVDRFVKTGYRITTVHSNKRLIKLTQ